MNDRPEEEEDDATTDLLIGEGDDWPEDYSDGFDTPMQFISKILSDSETWDLPISWPEVLSGWRDAREAVKFRMGSATRSISNPNIFAHERI
jgi:hypothetical protein